MYEKNLHAYIVRNFIREEAFWEAYYKDHPLIHKGIELVETGKTKRASIINEEYKWIILLGKTTRCEIYYIFVIKHYRKVTQRLISWWAKLFKII